MVRGWVYVLLRCCVYLFIYLSSCRRHSTALSASPVPIFLFIFFLWLFAVRYPFHSFLIINRETEKASDRKVYFLIFISKGGCVALR